MIKSACNRFIRLAGCAALAGSICTTAQAGTLNIGHSTWVGYGTLYLARDLGYFKEQGLEVNLSSIDSTSIYMAAMASGELSGSASAIDALMKYRSKDFCFKSVAALDESHGGDGLLASDDIQKVEDLKGKTVGVNEDSTSQFWLAYLLNQHGMSLADVETRNMTADDAATAFIAGRLPAAVTWEPNLTSARQRGVGKVLADSSATPGVIVDVVSLSCDVIEQQPDDVKALVSGLYKAVEYLKQNPEQAYEIMAKGVGGYLSDPQDLAEAAKGVRFYDQAMNEKLLGSPQAPGSIAEVINLAGETWSELLGRPVEARYPEMVDSSFLRP